MKRICPGDYEINLFAHTGHGVQRTLNENFSFTLLLIYRLNKLAYIVNSRVKDPETIRALEKSFEV